MEDQAKTAEHARKPACLYSPEQCRELDRCAIEEQGIPGIVLMKRAGRAAFADLLESHPDPARVTVLCGAGNNGGDGYIIAGLARERGIMVQVLALADEARLRGDARLAYDWAIEQGVTVSPYSADVSLPREGILVDAMLGTGLSGDVRGDYAVAIAAVNASDLPVLAVDIPSGLCGDTGRVLGYAVNAKSTVTFIGAKSGLYTAAGPTHCGSVHFHDLAVPAAVYQVTEARAELLSASVDAVLAPRSRTAHKGDFGHVLIAGGDLGMGGAALMAGQAAGRCGAGLVSVATRAEHLPAYLARCPELMVHAVASRADLGPVLGRATVLVLGPGLGSAAWGEGLLQCLLAAKLPTVLDADALNLLASRPSLKALLHGQHILTPHPGEAARLLGVDTKTVQQNRFAAAEKLQQQYGGSVVLKGAGTVICDQAQRLAVCPFGNPGMASGGMGDVLSGVLGALLAQGLDISLAARTGTVLHSRAADIAAMNGERGLLATDLLAPLHGLVNPWQAPGSAPPAD